MQWMLIAVFGACGAIGRYAISSWIHDWLGKTYYLGTLSVNVLGCFLLGVLVHIGQQMGLPDHWKLGLQVGLLGAFTTYSTFAYETLLDLDEGLWWRALTSVAANLVLGLLAVWGGLAGARLAVGG